MVAKLERTQNIALLNKDRTGLSKRFYRQTVNTVFRYSNFFNAKNLEQLLPDKLCKPDCSDSFTILGLWVLELAFSQINESNCKFMSPEHYF